MKLKLDKLGNRFVTGPLNDPGLFPGNPWMIDEVRELDDSEAFKVMGKYPRFFSRVGKGDAVEDLVKAKPGKAKDKLARPKGVN